MISRNVFHENVDLGGKERKARIFSHNTCLDSLNLEDGWRETSLYSLFLRPGARQILRFLMERHKNTWDSVCVFSCVQQKLAFCFDRGLCAHHENITLQPRAAKSRHLLQTKLSTNPGSNVLRFPATDTLTQARLQSYLTSVQGHLSYGQCLPATDTLTKARLQSYLTSVQGHLSYGQCLPATDTLTKARLQLCINFS
ncbi:hypothetical protein RRG08_022531 [Elysia crispata]|uniref:Uncharacterized protein n=1 Tax=Elysia crispata TaxID=231223 RepID=A0AAE0Z3D9_9GAST|nr:hypothetical protein RRG08_022531 [Elysia crispata]